MAKSPSLLLAALWLAPAVAAQTVVLDTFNSATKSGAVIDNNWTGQVTSNATSITVGGTAKDVSGWGVSGAQIDATGMGYIRITAQRDSGNIAASLKIAFIDDGLNTNGGLNGLFSVTTSAFAVGALTTVQIPISTWGTGFDLSMITDWSIGGGTTGLVAFRMTFEHLELAASLLPLNGGTIITAGDQVYTTAQVLGGTTTLGNTNGADLSGTAITFNSTINGAFGLTLNTGGTTTLTGAVGNTTPLASLTTDAGGTTVINGGRVKTTGAQTYNDPVSLGANTLFQSISDGVITFVEAITGNNHTLEVDTAGDGSFKSASGLTAFTKSGTGTFTLTGASTYTGTTTIAAGTLALGVNNALFSSSPLTLGGGTLALGGHTQTLGLLTITANSVFNFGGAGGTLTFADSSAQTWSGTLTISNYNTATNSLHFGSSGSGLTPTQLSLIRFADYGNVGGQIDALGLITPSAIPEPATYAVLAGLGALGLAMWRRERADAAG